MLKCGSQWLYGKRSFSVTTPCARPTRDNTERLAERETLLYRLGSELNRPFSILVETPLSVAQKHVIFSAARFFCEQSHSRHKRRQKRKLTIFGNTKQGIQDYNTVFDNSIPFRKNSVKMTYYGLRISELCALAPRQRVSHCRRPGHRGGRRRV
jgi:hypothetical protein